MKNLTKNQRHVIYKRALRNYDKYNKKFNAIMLGACEAVSLSATRGRVLFLPKNEINFPELHKFKDSGRALWLDHESDIPYDDYTARCEFRKLVLNFCVEMTK